MRTRFACPAAMFEGLVRVVLALGYVSSATHLLFETFRLHTTFPFLLFIPFCAGQLLITSVNTAALFSHGLLASLHP